MGNRSGYHHGDLRRSLLEAALALVAEEQGWDFSLREVARRAGVSHNAPYNHFTDKGDLLAALAAAGYEALRLQMLAVLTDAPDAALLAIGVAYVEFGLENPARYRLMFGAALACAKPAADNARLVLTETVARGVRDGCFAAPAQGPAGLEALALAAWSLVHGLTMLMIDGVAGKAVAGLPELVGRVLLEGVRGRSTEVRQPGLG